MKSKALSLLLLVFLSGVTLLRIGDFGVRLSVSDAIAPVSYAYYWQYPERFARDILSTYAREYTLSTMSNWLPALLLRTIALPPETSSWLLVYLQNVLLGFAVLRYTRLVTGRRGLAWLAVLFALTAQPWCWNLANYGSILSAPYPGQLALPLLLFAACEVLEDRTGRAVVWLAVSALVHPALTLYMTAIVGAFWLWRDLLQTPRLVARRRFASVGRLAALGAVAVLCVGPAFYVRITGGESVTAAELMLRVVGRNLHTAPWLYPATFSASAFSVAGSTLLALLGTRRLSGVHPAFPAWAVATAISCGLFALLLGAGVAAGSPLLLQLVPLRATVLWALFAMPLVLLYLADKAASQHFAARWAAVAVVLLYTAFVYGLAWGPLLALLFQDLADAAALSASLTGDFPLALGRRWSRRLRRASAAVLALWSALAAWASVAPGSPVLPVIGMLPTILSGSVTIPLARGIRLDAIPLAIALLALAAAVLGWTIGWTSNRPWRLGQFISRRCAWLAGVSHRRTASVALLALVLLAVMVFKAWRSGAETAQPAAQALYQAQLWARDNTPETAGFIAFGLASAWRPVSLRWTIDPQPIGWYLYAGRRATKAFDDAYLDFYGLGPDGDVSSAYHSLDEAGILRLARRFGGDYIVRLTTEPLGFPEAYRNGVFVIYHLVR